MAKLQDTDIASERLKLIEAITASRNVSAACQKFGMSRSQYYEFKRRYEQYGLEGLINRSSAHHTHPLTTVIEVEKQIIETSLEHPSWGSNKLYSHFHKEGIRISVFTIQKILKRNKLGNREERFLNLETKCIQENIFPTDEQLAFLSKFNPAYRERDLAPSYSGQVLCQDIILMGWLKDYTKIFMHIVIDSYSSFVFSLLRPNIDPEGAVTLLEKVTIPFFKEQDFDVFEIKSSRRNIFTRKSAYKKCLVRNHISWLPDNSSRKIGTIERFTRIVNTEFFKPALLSMEHNSLVNLQSVLDSWIYHYNYERPSLGFPNFGRRPIERMLDDY